ncbi:MAG: transaldolase [Acidimicrobiales bacterium]
MTRLHDLFEAGQSPWLDNLKRGWITSGELAAWRDKGVRGITSNPSIFQKAISGSDDYTEQFSTMLGEGASIEDSYWGLVTQDIEHALAIMRPVYDDSNGLDGYVSVEVDPSLARDTEATIASARKLDELIDEPNLYVKIPATDEGMVAIQQMITEGRSINVTLLFAIDKYQAVMEAYIAGLEARVGAGGDISDVSSVASFFISRIDVEVDRRLDAIGTPEALELRGKVAVANAQLAYKVFQETFSGERWEALAAVGGRKQRVLWASTSTKNPDYPNTLYVDTLIGPDSVNTLPDATIEAFLADGTVARTIDADYDAAQAIIDATAAVGVDLAAVTDLLLEQGVTSFVKSFDELIDTLGEKADTLGAT